MDRRKLEKLRDELEAMRRSSIRAADVESLASKLGRRKVSKKGKEPRWDQIELTGLYPLTIPHHGGKDFRPGTKKSLLDQLEGDIEAWEAYLSESEAGKSTNGNGFNES